MAYDTTTAVTAAIINVALPLSLLASSVLPSPPYFHAVSSRRPPLCSIATSCPC